MSRATKLHHVRRGAGPPLLLVQGYSATHRHWGERLLSGLAACFDVVAYDHRGTGGSAPVTAGFTIADLADDAAALLDDLGWDRAAVFGVSLGGLVGLELARHHPDRVGRLILGCPPFRDGPAGRAALPGTVVRGDPVATAANLFRMGVKDPDRLPPQAWSEYREAAVGYPVHPRTSVLQADALARHSAAGRLADVRAPTLVLHGDADRLVEVDEGIELAERIPGAQLRLLAAGHFFWLEDPAGTVRLLAGFCAGDDARQAGAGHPFGPDTHRLWLP